MKQKEFPIGYWIKQADLLLTNGVNTIHNTHGINRTSWQLLHTVQQEPNIALETLVDLLQPFADRAKIENELDRLAENGWLGRDGEKIYLTVSGEAFHSNCLQQQTAFREKSMQRITSQDYETTVKTLRQLVQNLS